jgi:hypothetical protein
MRRTASDQRLIVAISELIFTYIQQLTNSGMVPWHSESGFHEVDFYHMQSKMGYSGELRNQCESVNIT